MFNRAKQVARNTGNELIQLPQSDTPNYKVAATASSILALIYMTSSLEGGYFSSYLALAGLVFTSGVAIKQYGIQKAYQNVTSSVQGLFKPTNARPHQELTSIPLETLPKKAK